MRIPFQSWPEAADPDAAARLVDAFAESSPANARAARRPGFARLLNALGGNSPYLSDLALREARTLRALPLLGPIRVMDAILQGIAAIDPASKRSVIAAALRQAKRQAALTVAVADLGGIWRLDHVTGVLSALAEATLQLAVAHLLRGAHDAGALTLPHPQAPQTDCGFTVLGMGKLGARELNYSSDIDLILLFDPDRHTTHADSCSHVFARMARDLVALMEARDADGYVFRTDLRLRPDPASTPPAISLTAALTYYESLGQSWERAAMIKARPVAGDIALGDRFLDEIRPFVWRRHLDFVAIADLHQMKRRIDAHKGTKLGRAGLPVEQLVGHDVKLGEGGIREVEFIAQTLQLVWGGRDPALRQRQTVAALGRLVRAGHLAGRDAARLAVAYRFLRKVEHRLQMVADRQTHSLPDRPEDMARFATFMGFASPDRFATWLLATMRLVQAHYAAFFEAGGEPAEADAIPGLDSTKPLPETITALRALGYAEPDRVLATIAAWRAGQPRALRADRARSVMETLLPGLLRAVARQSAPDQVLARLDDFLQRLNAGVQVLSLLLRNKALLDRLVAVLGAAPRMADYLARVPAALDGLLSREDTATDPHLRLRDLQRDARALEDVIAITRRFVRSEEFRLSVGMMEGRLDVDRAGLSRTALADATISTLLPAVMADFESRNGVVPGGAIAVLALGKAGGQEMLAGSDLDLMLVYDHPEDVSESVPACSGARSVPVSQYYTRASHVFVAALTAPGAEGPLYPVDMRLRPSGNKGPVAVSFPAFQRYHRESAWTWERMALTRARVIVGPPGLGARLHNTIVATLCEARADVAADACRMRARMMRDLPTAGPWDVKHRAGGLIEVEFIAQVLQLQHAASNPDVLTPNTLGALRRLATAGVIAMADAEILMRADRIWRSIQDVLRLALPTIPQGEMPPNAAKCLMNLLSEPIRCPTWADLTQYLENMAADVRTLFVRYVGNPSELS